MAGIQINIFYPNTPKDNRWEIFKHVPKERNRLGDQTDKRLLILIHSYQFKYKIELNDDYDFI